MFIKSLWALNELLINPRDNLIVISELISKPLFNPIWKEGIPFLKLFSFLNMSVGADKFTPPLML
jgi:hypothetical protein